MLAHHLHPPHHILAPVDVAPALCASVGLGLRCFAKLVRYNRLHCLTTDIGVLQVPAGGGPESAIRED